jgi:predicted MPP superfamily phosphohydrolase
VVIGGLAAAVGAFGAGCFGYGVFVERNAFTLRRFTAPVLPAGERPMRVLHISDMHLSTDRRNLVRWVDSLAGLRPDLVVTTGDNLSQPEALPMVLEAYGRLFAYPGVFVFGSNDYFAPNPVNPLKYLGIGSDIPRERRELPHVELRRTLVERGWHDVEDSTIELEVDGRLVEVRGTKDAHLNLDRYELVAGAPDPAAVLSMGVTHAPYLRLLDAMTADGLDVIMAGHTHGGQVCVPFYGALTTNCDLDAARVKGLSSYTHEGRTSALHVSAGLGTSPYAPYRFACRPEATLLTLVAR